jgi:UDP-2,3-diacylglucosamine pyrophosphatase LpxH
MGDIVNMKEVDQDDPIKVEAGEAEMLKVLAYLTSLGRPVYYIPGNHDPVTVFSDSMNVTGATEAINIHRRTFHLAPGMDICERVDEAASFMGVLLCLCEE